MSEKLDTLCRAIELIEDEGRWTRRASARNSEKITLCYYDGVWQGDVLTIADTTPVCWCAYGAFQHVSNTRMALDLNDEFYALYKQSITVVNDDYGHEEVLIHLRGLATYMAEEEEAQYV